MALFAKVSILIILTLSQNLVQADYSKLYIERVKKNHTPKQVTTVLTKRIDLEVSKTIANFDIIFNCLMTIKENDTDTYQKKLYPVATSIENSLKKPNLSQSQREIIFSFIYKIASNSSLEDGFFLLDRISPQKPMAESSQLFYLVLTQMKPELYVKYFESKSPAVIENPEPYKTLIGSYCVAVVLTGELKKCSEKIDAIKKRQNVQAWVQEIDLLIKINSLDFAAATSTLKTLNEKCPPSPEVPWINFHIARLHRLQKNFTKSLDCLESFKNDTKQDTDALFFYYIEYGKTTRFTDIGKSDIYINEADKLNQKRGSSFSFFELIVDIEKMKNFILKGDKENTKKYLSRITTQYKVERLKPYSEFINWLKNYSVNKTESINLKSDSFEIYDFSLLLQVMNETAKKSTY